MMQDANVITFIIEGNDVLIVPIFVYFKQETGFIINMAQSGRRKDNKCICIINLIL